MSLNKTLGLALATVMTLGAAGAHAADATTVVKKKKKKAATAAVQKKAPAKAAAVPAAAKATAAPAAAAPAVVPAAAPAAVAAPAVAPVAPAAAPAPVVQAAAPAAAPADAGWKQWASQVYAGVGVGQTRWNLSDQPNGRTDKTGNAFKVFAGHTYHSWFAAEVGLASLGKSTLNNGADDFSFKANSLYLDGVGTIPLPIPGVTGLDALGRLGATYTDTKLNGDSKKSAGLKWGVGAQWQLPWVPQVKVRGEFESYPVKTPAVGGAGSESSRVKMFSIGGVYQF